MFSGRDLLVLLLTVILNGGFLLLLAVNVVLGAVRGSRPVGSSERAAPVRAQLWAAALACVFGVASIVMMFAGISSLPGLIIWFALLVINVLFAVSTIRDVRRQT